MRIVAGTHRNRTIVSPKGLKTRPTSERLRETLFNICQSYIVEARFLDLFAGSGAMGLEALSRGAANAVFVDKSKDSIRCIQQNLENLQLQDRARILCGDVFLMLQKLNREEEHFDIIYVDPPYTTASGPSISSEVLKMIDQSSVLVPSGILFFEESRAYPPNPKDLSRLTLVSSREIGNSILQQYRG